MGLNDEDRKTWCFLNHIHKKVYMRFVGTHEEYDKIKDIKNI
ncbi:HigB_toxin, RelE-like toxic component of a toxin-antitoxin system [Xylanibacter ruminicola]|uniref:HigB_toxin, RelE-like toxic component of a toxin-antitoxin system n=1 Tax=Xylanibacter ruminicola TaxID=839 RepID=A0A1M7MUJ2_XYLRU|nr:HigB_toxin, RelE-like toxic component of a toxin-antitoxin system [Xylanibacter ruminicola]